MSNLKNKLNKTLDKTAVDKEFEENGSIITEEVANHVFNASSEILRAYESIEKDQYFKEYLNSKGYNGNEITLSISNLYDILDKLQKDLYEAADRAEY